MLKFFRLSKLNFAVTLSPSTWLRTGYEMKQNQRSGLPEKAQSAMAGRPLVEIALPTGRLVNSVNICFVLWVKSYRKYETDYCIYSFLIATYTVI